MKLRHFLSIVLLQFFWVFLSAQPAVLSPSAEVSILTCGLGEALFSKFGHTGLEIRDPETNLHKVYNYGTFDFDTPFFYAKYLRGALEYHVSVDEYDEFLASYKGGNRTIYKQTLNLDEQQVNIIYNLIKESLQPENKYYTYEFIKTNCTTRVRDILNKALAADLNFDDAFLDQHLTFRDYLNANFEPEGLITTGLNLLYGNKTDQLPTLNEYQFLPENLMLAIANGFNGSEPLVKDVQLVNQRIEDNAGGTLGTYFLWAVVVIFFMLSYWGYRNNVDLKWVDIAVFSVAGVLGLIILFMWLVSFHEPTHYNPDLLWLNPLHFLFLFKLKNRQFTFYYTMIFGVLTFGLLVYYLYFDLQTVGVYALMFIVLVRLLSRLFFKMPSD